MTIHTFKEDSLLRRLGRMSRRAQGMFAAACAERLVSSHHHARSRDSEKACAVLRRAMDQLWEALETEGSFSADLQGAIADCEDVATLAASAPASSFSPRLEDASAALFYALRSCSTGSSQEAAWAARRAYEAMDSSAQEALNPELGTSEAEMTVLSHQLVQEELARQSRDLDALEGVQGTSRSLIEVLETLRLRAIQESRTRTGAE